MEHTYPNILIESNSHEIKLSTNLRKQGKDGLWYKVLISTWFISGTDIGKAFELFGSNVYSFIVLGIVDVEGKIKTIDGENWCKLDENQYSEEERLASIALGISVDELRKRRNQKQLTK